MEKVNIVIVSHNNKDILPTCLDALKSQTYKNFKIHIVDNDSTDGTKEFIEENYPYVRFTEISAGVSEKRNLAISQSESEYIITLDSDAFLEKNWIKNAVEYMKEHKDVGICCGKMIKKDGLIDYAGGAMAKNGGVIDVGHNMPENHCYNTFKRISVMTTASAIIRRKTIEDIGGFDEDYYYDYEDADFGLRANFSGWKVVYNPDLIATHLSHTTLSKMDRKKHNKLVFFGRRNRIITLLKNFEVKTIIINSPFIIPSLLYGLSKDFFITLRAYSWILSNFDKIKEMRRKTLSKKRISDKELFSVIPFQNFGRDSKMSGNIFYFLARINTKALKNITFFITSRCNSKCKHCFYWKDLNNSKDLTLEEISKIFSKFYNVHSVSLGGGEPFMRKDIDKIVKLVVKYTNAKAIDIPTNGLIDIIEIFEKILKENPQVKFSIEPSLDGLKEEHEYIRGVEGNFEKTINLIYKLSELRKKYPNFSALTVNTVVTNKNYSCLPELIEFVKKLPVTGHSFEIIRGDHKQILAPPEIKKIEEFSRLAYKTRKYYGKNESFIRRIFYNLKIRELWEIQINAVKKKEWPFKCTAGRTDLIIESDGTMRICELQPKVGDLIKETPEEILESKKAKEIFSKIENHKCDCTHNCNISSSMDCYLKNIFWDRFLPHKK